MDQKAWREIEDRCIQEEAPPCTARCPIHVDVRAFLREVTAGQWDRARRTLTAAMPFPGIIGRICDHPCEEVCRRREAGEAISIGELERAAVNRGRIKRRLVPLPQKAHWVGIIGSGLSSATAAFELARKGYGVTLFEARDRLGGDLWKISENDLPREVIGEELAILEELHVQVNLSTDLGRIGLFNELMNQFDVVYLGMDSGIEEISHYLSEDMVADHVTAATSKLGFFVGGGTHQSRSYSSIAAVADGRRAAISIDRFLQKVSLTASREREGPYESRLFTNLEGIPPRNVVRMGNPDSGYSEDEAQEEAGRCIQCECMECVKQCLFLEQFKAYPKRYVRQVSNDATMVLGAHGPTRKLVNSCTLCGLCTVLCPNDLSMALVCMEGRRNLVERGKMPISAHDFALQDMLSTNSDKAALALHEPGKSKSKFAFFPGCQLSAIYPEHVMATYSYLRNYLKDGTGLILHCCGAPAKWAARNDLFEDALHGLEKDWEGMDRPELIVACPTCHQVFKEHLPHVGLTALWTILDESLKGAQPGAKTFASNLAIHDPCTTRYEPEIQKSVRQLLTKMGVTFEELDLSRDKTECCGFGGLMAAANPSLAKDVAIKRASRSEADYVTYCAMCCHALVSTGKQVLHILDLFFTEFEPSPGIQKALGHSERRENRYHLKQKLLKTLWEEKQRPMEEYEKIVLHISNDVLERMEERRILREDVQKVIDHAEKIGARLFNLETGRSLASFRPAHVTYWVEYTPEGDGFRVHNAYNHRMEVVKGGNL